MEEQNNLSIGIRARILPTIEGADQLKSEITNLPSTISNRMAETISSPAFKEGLSEQQVKKLEHLTGLTDTFEFQKIQERQKEITDDLTIDLDRGKLTASQQKKHLGRFAKYGQSVEGLGEFISTELDEPQFDFLSQSQKTILRTAATQGAKEAAAGISGVNQRFEQINYANDYMRNVGKLEKEQFQRHKNLEYDLEEGGYTKQRGQRYLKEERAAIRQMEELQQAAKEKFGDTEFGDRVFKTMGDDIEAAKMRMKDFADEIEKASKGSGNLLQSLRTSGLLTLSGIAIDAGLRYQTRTEQIEARERTSFDFSSPLSMYNAREQNEAYKYTTERTRDYELAGGAIGAGVGALGGALMGGKLGAAAGPWGMVGGVVLGGISGYMTGSDWGTKQAELGKEGNIAKRMEVEEELKFFNESYGTLSGYVGQSRGYDIERARTRARLGEQAFSSNIDEGLGYNPEERLRMRNSFADNYGKWDEKLYGEQTTFARAKGIDPEALYSLNLSARMTGMDTSLKGLDQAKQIATATYGENASSQRIIDILSDLKNINERLLQTNLDADSRDAMRAAIIPSMIFGDSPYGRLGEKAGDTTNVLSKLGQGDNLAKEAWLYSAYKVKDPLEFLERVRKGALDPENFRDIKEKIQRDSNGNQRMARLEVEGLLDYDKKIPANMVPDIAKYMLSGEEPTKENLDKKIAELEDKYGKKVGNYQSDAERAVPESLSREEKIATTINEAADKWRTTVYDMAEASADFWKKMGSSAEYHKLFIEKMASAIEDMGSIAQRIMENLGIKTAPAPKDVDSLGGSDIIKSRFDDVRDKKQEKATGWVKEHAEKLREFVAENTRGEYLVNLHAGYDPTGKGHAPKSAHYKNTETEGAMDVEVFRMNDQGKMVKIPKYEIPKDPALNTLFNEYAKENNIRWGGNFKTSWENGQYVDKPDPNHFDYLPYNGAKKPIIDQELHKEAEQFANEKVKKEDPKQNINRDREFHKEIFPLKGVFPLRGSIMNLGRIDPDILEHNKKLEELAKKRMPQQTAETLARARESGIQVESEKPVSNKNIYEFRANESAVEFAPKEKQHSFFERNTETNKNFTIDASAIETAFERVFSKMNLGNMNREEPKEIIIRDRTINGITSQHAEATSKNANSIFGGQP
jgi:hypothetical protein